MATPTFKFLSEAYAAETFIVTGMQGEEAISRLSRFSLELKAPEDVVIEPADLLEQRATLQCDYDGQQYPWHGIISTFEIRHASAGYIHYYAELVPSVWRLSIYKTNEIFRKQTVVGIITEVLTNAGFAEGTDFDLSGLTLEYPEREYICQFRESDFDFISRQMEHEGIYYYFEHADGVDKLVLADGRDYREALLPNAVYRPDVSGQDFHESVTSWVCRTRRVPASVSVRDFNPEQPSEDVHATHEVDPAGNGEVYLYGENFSESGYGAQLAKVRAEELLAEKTQFHAGSGLSVLHAGETFNLSGHALSRFNAAYLVTEISHRGQQLDAAPGQAAGPQYQNTFSAVTADVQFRPARSTPLPRFYGTMTASIYAETGDELAEMDELGRYRVKLPFDRAGGKGEKATHWIRMARPYAGREEGDYRPMRNGTEVLLTFLNGDPDRPVITSAVPNGANPSLLTASNPHQSVSQTPGTIVQIAKSGRYVDLHTREMQTTTAPDFPLLGAGGKQQGSETLDETAQRSGDYLINKQFGDTYRYRDGRTYAWGNEEVYNFGNDYEELHQNSDVTPDDEVFVIPMLGDQEKSAGLVEKNWGNKYEYHFGDSYNYSGSSAAEGWHREFNYGNGYTENLILGSAGTETFDNVSELSKSKHKAYQKKSDWFASGSGGAQYTVEKTWGNTYSYQKGNAMEVQEGSTHSEQYGDAYEKMVGNSTAEVTGNSTETITGDLTSTITGDTTETVYGDSIANIHGRTTEHHFGRQESTFMGGSAEFQFAESISLYLGAKQEFDISLKMEVALAAAIEMFMGAKIEMCAGALCELKTIQIGSKTFDVEATPMKVSSKALSIDSGALKIFA